MKLLIISGGIWREKGR